MRTLGISEKYITGNADSKTKFQKWAYTVPYTMRNSLYHWTHMKLKNYFGIETLLNQDSADKIYQQPNEQLQQPFFTSPSLRGRMNVEMSCTTDDHVDSIKYHKELQDSDFGITVLPLSARITHVILKILKPTTNRSTCWRRPMAPQSAHPMTCWKLSKTELHTFTNTAADFLITDWKRFSMLPHLQKKLANAFNKIRIEGKQINEEQKQALIYYLMLNLSRMYNERGWVQQFQMGLCSM